MLLSCASWHWKECRGPASSIVCGGGSAPECEALQPYQLVAVSVSALRAVSWWRADWRIYVSPQQRWVSRERGGGNLNSEELVIQARRIQTQAQNSAVAVSALTQASELVRVHAGEKSAFYRTLQEVNQNWTWEHIAKIVNQAMDGFITYVENGLLEGLSIERQARIDVVSDILGQAQGLLEAKDVHPAAPAVLVGSALEEFLRNWCKEADLKLGNRKPGIKRRSSRC